MSEQGGRILTALAIILLIGIVALHELLLRIAYKHIDILEQRIEQLEQRR